MRKVQPTFVLFSPYAFQNNKKIEFAAKHGSLFFAIISALCMILIRFYTSGNFWILFLPQFVFYSIVYVFARNCNNKTFQFTQILITYLLVFYNEYLFIFANLNFEFNYFVDLIVLAVM
uniref:O-antigen ligase family protein n=1 Tax=Panagrellus redivivus TaxID=6233 RepID=A0A7E4VDH9_PANRE